MTDDKATPASERHAELTSRYQGDYDEHVAGCHWLHNNHSYFAGRDDAEPALTAERDRADRAEARLGQIKADAWELGMHAGFYLGKNARNPYRSEATA